MTRDETKKKRGFPSAFPGAIFGAALLLVLSLTGCDSPVNPVDPGSGPGPGPEPELSAAPVAPGAPELRPADSQITAAWSSVPGAASYEVWYGTAADGAGRGQFGGDITGTDVTITGLDNGTTYWVWIRAKNAAGTSGYGPAASAAPVSSLLIIEAIGASLDAAPGGAGVNDPVPLAVNIQLSAENWRALCEVLNQKQKYVKLDLSDCTPGTENGNSDDLVWGLNRNTDFVPAVTLNAYGEDPARDGQAYVVELIIPDAATAIVSTPWQLIRTGETVSNNFGELTTNIYYANGNVFFAFTSLKALTARNLQEVLAGIFKPAPSVADAYKGPRNLESITLGRRIETVGSSAFNGLRDLVISLEGTGGAQVISGGKVLVTAAGQIILFPATSPYSVDLSSLTGVITSYASLYANPVYPSNGTIFAGKNYISAVVLPSTVTELGVNAFANCTNLTSVTLPSGLTSIGGNAFVNCSPNLTFYGGEAVLNGKGIVCVSGADKTLAYILPGALSGNVNFGSISGLTAITATLGGINGAPNTAINSITVPEGITTLPAGFAAFCSNLASVTLPSTLTALPNTCFRACTNLASVTINSPTVAALASTTAFAGTTCAIYVPAALVDQYKAAANWSNASVKDRIQAIP